MIYRGMGICGVIVFLGSLFGGYNDMGENGNLFMGILGLIVGIGAWNVPKWFGWSDKL